MKALQNSSLRFALQVLTALACGFLMTGCALVRSFAYGTESCANPHPGHTVICIDNDPKATPDPAHTPADQEIDFLVDGPAGRGQSRERQTLIQFTRALGCG